MIHDYKDSMGRADFRVKYLWLAVPGSDFVHSRFQHMRCDFAYRSDDIQETGIFMIWPQFEDEDQIPLPKNAEVPIEGTASMWIVNREHYADYHRARIDGDTQGFMMAGSRKLAEVSVIELLRLAD